MVGRGGERKAGGAVRRRARPARGGDGAPGAWAAQTERGSGLRTPEGVKEGTGTPQAEHSRLAGPREARRGPAGSGTSRSGSLSRLCKQLAMRSPAAAPATGPARHLRGTCSWRKCTRSPPWGGGGWPQGVVKTPGWPGLGPGLR